MKKKKKTYKRDGRAPIPEKESTSAIMSANKGKDTKPELIFRKALFKAGLRGYRLHWKIAGKPDITYPGRKIAIFINGCFWHRCPHCKPHMPRSNTEYWERKFSKNKERDKKNERVLKEAGWQVLVIWECQLKENLEKCIQQVRDLHSLDN